MECVKISFVDDGGLSAYGNTLEYLKKHASSEVNIDEGVIKEIPIGPIIYIPGDIIVAGIGALSLALSAILTYRASLKSGKIILKGKNGRSIEIPRDMKKEEIDFFIEKAKELDADHITFYHENH